MTLDAILGTETVPETGIVISASRTKDLVRCNPNLLAQVLTGEVNARYSRHPETTLDLASEKIQTLVLWTKDPSNILENQALNEAIVALRSQGTLIDLQLTVSGWGGTPIELGIPRPSVVIRCLNDLIQSETIDLVMLRFDPVLKFQDETGKTSSNMTSRCLSEVLALFAPHSSRVTTSIMDLSYQSVVDRFHMMDLRPIAPTIEEREAFISEFKTQCRALGLTPHVCGDAAHSVGCIDAPRYNYFARLEGFPRGKADVRYHNDVGTQRPGCSCTHSRDIGFTPKLKKCFSQGSGCLYCYSQGKPNETLASTWKKAFVEFDEWRLLSCPEGGLK